MAAALADPALLDAVLLDNAVLLDAVLLDNVPSDAVPAGGAPALVSDPARAGTCLSVISGWYPSSRWGQASAAEPSETGG